MALIRRRSRPTGPGDGTAAEESPDGSLQVVPPEPPAPPAVDDGLPPSRLRGTEPTYGYAIGIELLVVAILNLVIRTGAGAPAHPQTTLEVIGVVASLGYTALISTRNRTVVGLAAIAAAFFVTLPKAPNSLYLAHLLALIFPLVYGILITQRQRKAISRTLGGRRGAARTGMAARARQRDEQRDQARKGRPAQARRGGRVQPPPQSGPRRNSRYTPPKAKRGR